MKMNPDDVAELLVDDMMFNPAVSDVSPEELIEILKNVRDILSVCIIETKQEIKKSESNA